MYQKCRSTSDFYKSSLAKFKIASFTNNMPVHEHSSFSSSPGRPPIIMRSTRHYLGSETVQFLGVVIADLALKILWEV